MTCWYAKQAIFKIRIQSIEIIIIREYFLFLVIFAFILDYVPAKTTQKINIETKLKQSQAINIFLYKGKIEQKFFCKLKNENKNFSRFSLFLLTFFVNKENQFLKIFGLVISRSIVCKSLIDVLKELLWHTHA